MPLSEDLQRSLYRIFEQAQNKGDAVISLSSAELYRRTAGSAPSVPHVVISSAVLRSAAKPGDAVVNEHSDEVTIRYRLPRPAHQRSRLFS